MSRHLSNPRIRVPSPSPSASWSPPAPSTPAAGDPGSPRRPGDVPRGGPGRRPRRRRRGRRRPPRRRDPRHGRGPGPPGARRRPGARAGDERRGGRARPRRPAPRRASPSVAATSSRPPRRARGASITVLGLPTAASARTGAEMPQRCRRGVRARRRCRWPALAPRPAPGPPGGEPGRGEAAGRRATGWPSSRCGPRTGPTPPRSATRSSWSSPGEMPTAQAEALSCYASQNEPLRDDLDPILPATVLSWPHEYVVRASIPPVPPPALPDFDAMYGADDDPWDVESSWYERRKLSVLLATLPREHYDRAWEPGCGPGLVSARLADRVGELVASDSSTAAIGAGPSSPRDAAPRPLRALRAARGAAGRPRGPAAGRGVPLLRPRPARRAGRPVVRRPRRAPRSCSCTGRTARTTRTAPARRCTPGSASTASDATPSSWSATPTRTSCSTSTR